MTGLPAATHLLKAVTLFDLVTLVDLRDVLVGLRDVQPETRRAEINNRNSFFIINKERGLIYT